MHKYAAPIALTIALNITMLALAVSASLTAANAANGADFSSAHPSRASIWPRGEAMRDKYGIARPQGRTISCAGAQPSCAAAKISWNSTTPGNKGALLRRRNFPRLKFVAVQHHLRHNGCLKVGASRRVPRP
jgi:hypothetical protein